jgi:exoribonuclease-2
MSEEEVLFRVSAAEAAAGASSRAERASRAHWLAVYLLGKMDEKNLSWQAIVLDRKGNRASVVIPELGIETQVNVKGTEKPNEAVRVKIVSVKIPEAEISFAMC